MTPRVFTNNEQGRYEGPERREETNVLSGLPVWVRAAAVLGVPSLIALFLVWVGARELPRMNQELIVQRQEVQKNREMYQEHLHQQEEIYRLMQRICSNTAKSELERQRCFDR